MISEAQIAYLNIMHQGEGQVWLSLKVNNRSKAFGLKLVKMNNITKKIVLKLLTAPVCKIPYENGPE